VIAGAVAAVTGFGIGSLLTPVLAYRLGMEAAVAIVAVPHAAATALRYWRLRRQVDGRVLVRFGLLSAAGGLSGALLYARASNRALTIALGLLLVATAVAALTRWSARWSPRGAMVGVLGFSSGAFGGLAGNQGGLRAMALLAFGLSPVAFVATSTATGLLVDAARLPVYLWSAGEQLAPNALLLGVTTLGVLMGTIAGERVLFGLSPERFRRAVGVAVAALGVWLLLRAV